MFNPQSSQQKKNSFTDKIEKGELSIEEAQKIVNFKQLETQVNEFETSARDHGNLVDLRNIWGKVILGILVATIIGDFFLVWKVGSGQWKFQGNSQFLNVVATEHLAQILGLVLVVLKALFPGNEK